MAWSSQAVYANLKAILADVTGRDAKDIFARHSLTEDLRLSPEAVRGLTPRLQETFRADPRLDPDVIGACQTVRELHNEILKVLPHG